MDRRKNPRSFDSYLFCCIRLGMKSEAFPTRSRGIDSWSRRLRLGLENCAFCALVWKVAPIRLGLGRLHALIAKFAPHPSRWEELVLGCAVSASVWKIARSPPLSGKSCRLHPGLESRTVSALFWKVVPHALWSRRFPLWLLKSCSVHHGRKELFLSRAVSASVWKVAPSPPCFEKSRRLCLGLESRAVSAFVAWNWFLVASSPRWSGKQRPFRLGLKSRTVSTWVRSNKILVAPFPPWSEKQIAPSPSWSVKSRRLSFVLKSRVVSAFAARNWFLVAPSPPRSGKSRRMHHGLGCLISDC